MRHGISPNIQWGFVRRFGFPWVAIVGESPLPRRIRERGERKAGEFPPLAFFFFMCCPYCGMSSCEEERIVGDGLFGECRRVIVCAFCGRELPGKSGAPKVVDTSLNASSSGDPLDSLFGDNADARDTGLALECGESRFCRTCAHSLFHLFQNRCLLHRKDVEPMQICKDYKKR